MPGIDYYKALEDICKVLLNNTNIDIETVKNIAMPRITVSMHDLVNRSHKSILQLLSLIESRNAEG